MKAPTVAIVICSKYQSQARIRYPLTLQGSWPRGASPRHNPRATWRVSSPHCLATRRQAAMDGQGARVVEQRAKESDDGKSHKFHQSRGISELIMPHLLNIYGSQATARDFDIYAPNATFEDPLMRAQGVKQIKSAFYSLPKIFSESRIVEYTVQENAIAPGKVEVLIDNKQHYKIFGNTIDVVSLIKLNVEEGKIVRHEDWWDKKPLKNRDTVKLPLVGRLAEITRRGSMMVTHALMGFGKDPTN